MVIRYISAGDRLNYGDFLFPIIFDKYFHQSFKIEYYGIVDSDYSTFGAFQTRSYKDLISEIKKGDRGVIVVGGGEVFFAKWRNLYLFINPFYSNLLRNRLINKIDRTFNISKIFFFRTKKEFPYIPNLGCNTIYIAAGGQFSQNQSRKEKEYIKKQLNKSLLLSVRDSRTHLSLKENGVSAELIPDSAVLLSKIFSKETILSKVNNKDILNIQKDNYLLLQLGRFKAPNDLISFVRDINTFTSKYNLKVICCPIGYAPGHEDHIILKKLCEIDASWNFIPAQNIYEIMHLVLNSKIYMGTSLHGLITAFSFLKPVIALNKNLKKVDSFIHTWCSEFYELPIHFDEVALKADQAFKKWDKVKASEQLDYCQNKVEDYFNKTKDYLNVVEKG